MRSERRAGAGSALRNVVAFVCDVVVEEEEEGGGKI